ncbi:MAG: hypothetical protein AB2A00_12970 [Myxococcota bacterium]
MNVLVPILLSGALLPGQILQGTTTAQVGALYEGGDNGRPRLNAERCRDLTGAVEVVYTVNVTTTGVTLTNPTGVLYTQDVSIPAPSTSTASSSGGVAVVPTLTSPVQCSEPQDGKILLDNIAMGQGAFELRLSQMRYTPLSDLMSDLCETDGGVRKRRAVCLGIRGGQGNNTVARGGDGPDIDTVPPGAPGAISAEVGDGEAHVSVDPPANADNVERALMTYVIQYRRCTPEQAGVDTGSSSSSSGGTADGGTRDAGRPDAATTTEDLGECGAYAESSAQGSPVEVTGLENGVTYQLRARAVDDFGNAGPAGTQTIFVTPKKEYGFLDLYQGPVYGLSCQQMGGSSLWWFMAAGAWWVIRRRNRSR